MTKNQINLEELSQIIDQRIASQDSKSYVNNLINSGINSVAQKVGEEATEVVIASIQNHNEATSKAKEHLINEFCDLFFHSLILMKQNNIDLSDLYQEFFNRNQQKK